MISDRRQKHVRKLGTGEMTTFEAIALMAAFAWVVWGLLRLIQWSIS